MLITKDVEASDSDIIKQLYVMLPEKDLTGASFIDSSPVMFEYVLDWCRYRKLIADQWIDLEGFEVVADSFRLKLKGRLP